MKPRVSTFGSDFSLHRVPQGWFSFISVRLGLRVGDCSFSFHFILLLDSSFSFPFIGWLQGERRAPPRLKASVLLSHLSLSRRRLAERRGMTQPSSVRSKTISATSKNLPRGKSSQREVSIFPNFSTSSLRGYSDGWDTTEGMTVAKRYVPNKALKKKNGYCLGTKSPAANKRSRGTKELSKIFSEKQRAQEKARRRKALKRMQ